MAKYPYKPRRRPRPKDIGDAVSLRERCNMCGHFEGHVFAYGQAVRGDCLRDGKPPYRVSGAMVCRQFVYDPQQNELFGYGDEHAA